MTAWIFTALPPRLPSPHSPIKLAGNVAPPKVIDAKHKYKLQARYASSPALPPQSSEAFKDQSFPLPDNVNIPDHTFRPESWSKTFDPNMALKTARKIANEKDPARAELPVAQLDDHPLYPAQRDSKLARDIQKATRPDCRKNGNLLSPLIWLMDKKDSGCKF